MTREQIAVLVMAYGGPGNLDEVEPYLKDIRGGRVTRPALVEEIRARYARIGGRSPLLEHTRDQAAGIGKQLGDRFNVYVGMRHWHPYIADVVDAIVRAGHERVVGVAMAPHYSNMSVGAYEKKLLQAADERLDVALIRSWWSEARFLDAVATRVTDGLQRFPRPSTVQVIFTAHSLPEKILASADPYPDELTASAKSGPRAQLKDWRFAYRALARHPSRGSAPTSKTGSRAWLRRATKRSCSFHRFRLRSCEILYDIDVECGHSPALNIQLERSTAR